MFAARTLDKNFQFREKSKYAATVENVARIIDYSTRLPLLVPEVQKFVRSNPWYVHKEQRMRHELNDAGLADWIINDSPYNRKDRLESNVEGLRQGVRHLEEIYDQLPQHKNGSTGTFPSALAWAAQKNLYSLWDWTGQKGRIKLTPHNVAAIVDITAKLTEIMDDCHWLCKRSPWLDKYELQRHMGTMRKGLKVFELMRNRLPVYAPENSSHVKVIVDVGDVQKELTAQQQRELQELSARLVAARTPAEEQRILRDWRIHTNA